MNDERMGEEGVSHISDIIQTPTTVSKQSRPTGRPKMTTDSNKHCSDFAQYRTTFCQIL